MPARPLLRPASLRAARSALRPATPLLLLLLVLTTACGGSGDDAPAAPRSSASASPEATRELRAGTCWGDQQLPQALGEEGFTAWSEKYAGGDADLAESMRDDAALTDEVDCDRAHALELYDVVELPAALDRRVTSYADLLDQDSALHDRVRDQVNDRCLAGSTYGRAQRRAGDLPVQLGPSLAPDSGLHLAWDPFPADLWEQGQRKFVCTFEQDEPGTLAFADLATRRTPVGARVCLDTPGRSVACRQPHQGEEIGEMILNTAVARGDVQGERAVRTGTDGRYVALSDAEYARLDRVCQTLYRTVSTGREDIVGRAYPGAVDQWPNDQGVYVASCFAVDGLDPLRKVRGTVFDRG
ncbi:hypothetical protein SAMN04488570_3352 [Nocardioides scoriae]|uniref:Septum formation n=1 Tax=Nocardioides scoriae TaxID=642780 RepID=A0A1H1X4Q2_9ACTN|nr:hypothetical protein [Nocardioides scoriae]SDT03549.1 hypothetical protein SAMN04488570_3352 [Nocardioides scoriae]